MGQGLSRLLEVGNSRKYVSEYVQTEESMLSMEVATEAVAAPPMFSTPDINIMRHNLLDPRSATLGITRTPLILPLSSGSDGTPRNTTVMTELEYEESPRAVEDYSLTPDISQSQDIDDSELSSDCNKQKEIDDKGEGPEEIEAQQESDEDDRHQEAEDVDHDNDNAMTDEEDNRDHELEERRRNLALLKKKLFLTPEPQKMTASRGLTTKSGRTPLGIVCHNRGSGGRARMIGGGEGLDRGWKVMSEERARLGLENTPPNPLLPPIQDKVFSSPLRKSRHSRPLWDNDNTLLI